MLDFKISIISAETDKCRVFDSTFEYADSLHLPVGNLSGAFGSF